PRTRTSVPLLLKARFFEGTCGFRLRSRRCREPVGGFISISLRCSISGYRRIGPPHTSPTAPAVSSIAVGGARVTVREAGYQADRFPTVGGSADSTFVHVV